MMGSSGECCDENPRPETVWFATNEIKVEAPFWEHPRLYVFVNDAVIGFPTVWNVFYKGNAGVVRLSITKISPGRNF
jgi:hypothetical protein